MVKGVIFDLDMCILDTHSLTGPFFEPVLEALNSSDLAEDLKAKVAYQLWTTSLEDTVGMFSLPDEVAEKMREAYSQIEVPEGIKTFGDEEYIRHLPVKKVLVTSGYRKFQQTKIDKLAIADLFDEVQIDALDDREQRKGKKRIFEELLKKYGWNKNEVLVVGDNPVSELKVAKELGIVTVQTLRPTITAWPEADHQIRSFEELASLL